MFYTFCHTLRFTTFIALLALTLATYAREISIIELKDEDKEHFDKFRELFLTGTPEDFYTYTEKYAEELRSKEYYNLYYKLKNNQGFYALRHRQVYRAMQFAKELENDVRNDDHMEYFYLPLGLMGDIYHSSHDTQRAEDYFLRAIDEVDNRDPKFTMRIYHSLAEMMSITRPKEALEWTEKATQMAKSTGNIEYLSLSLGMKGYVLLLSGKSKEFLQNYEDYIGLRSQKNTDFNPRYNNIMEVGRMAFNNELSAAINKVREGKLAVDSSLVMMNLHALAGETDSCFQDIRHRYVELDSIYSLSHEASFGDLAKESSMLYSQRKVKSSQKLVRWLIFLLAGVLALFLILYLIGRRKQMQKMRQHNAELKKALAKAEESDRMKSAFISNVSHEIRTPLNAVEGFSEVLCNSDIELDEQEKNDMKKRIVDNVDAITSIINELLELSKSQSEGGSRKPDEELQDVEVNALCRQLLKEMHNRPAEGVELRFATNVDNSFTIRSDSNTICRILTHLFNNAFKFTTSGHVELRVIHHAKAHTLRLVVTDTGPGIAEENREKVFNMFEKTNAFSSGIGLGLPISRQLAASLGGVVVLDEGYSDGCRFEVILPA